MSMQASTAALRRLGQRLFLRRRCGSSRPASGFLSALVPVMLVTLGSQQCVYASRQKPEPETRFRESLQQVAALSPDPCGPSDLKAGDWLSAPRAEYNVFRWAAETITKKLNAASRSAPPYRVTEVLKNLEQLSADINGDWPEENRFHFQILEVPPVIVVKMTIRTDGRYFVFAVPNEDVSGQEQPSWHEVGSDDASLEQYPVGSEVQLFPLHRGPSGNVRFLAKLEYTGCAGSVGVEYDAREWDPEGFGNLEQVIKQSGSFGLDDSVPDFPRIGELETEGSLISLPYCRFSAIDTWDNPSLCAVDTYDLSADEVQFVSRAYNRPDLAPIAKVIEFAQQRDYVAVLAYCASNEVARELIRAVPPHFFAEDVRVTQTGNGQEQVELGSYRFDVEEHGDRWLVVAFSNDEGIAWTAGRRRRAMIFWHACARQTKFVPASVERLNLFASVGSVCIGRGLARATFGRR